MKRARAAWLIKPAHPPEPLIPQQEAGTVKIPIRTVKSQIRMSAEGLKWEKGLVSYGNVAKVLVAIVAVAGTYVVTSLTEATRLPRALSLTPYGAMATFMGCGRWWMFTFNCCKSNKR